MPRAFNNLRVVVAKVLICKTIVKFRNLDLLDRHLLSIRLSGYLFV
jgi:hypothetical protein